MKQEYKMTQKEMNDILEINKNRMPVLKIGNVTTGMDLQEKIDAYWDGLSKKYCFDTKTVEPSGKGDLFFLAEYVKPKSQTEIEMEKYDTLKKIVSQLEGCNYECGAGCLNMNIAFLRLKEMAVSE